MISELIQNVITRITCFLCAFLPIERLLRAWGPVYHNVETILKTVGGTFSPFPRMQGAAESKWNVTICQEAGFKYPKDSMAINDNEKAKILPKFQYALKHAAGIYPPWVLALLQMTPKLGSIFKSTHELIAMWFGLDVSDRSWMIYPKNRDALVYQRHTFLNLILYTRGRNEVFEPPFYFMRDDINDCYVLSIRGSTSPADWITDLAEATAETPEFMMNNVHGHVHDGMLESAQWIYNQVIEEVRQIYADKTKRKHMIVTGHSLGAGVASLLGLLILRDSKKNKDIIPHLQVYSFATPAVVSQNIGELEIVQKHIHSIILNTDIVGRIGAQAAKQYKSRIDHIQQFPNLSNNELGLHFAERPITKASHLEPENIIYPAGNVYWYIPKNFANKGRFGIGQILWSIIFADNTNYCENEWDLINGSKNRNIFAELLIDGNESIYAHFPNRYAWAMGLTTNLKTDLKNAH